MYFTEIYTPTLKISEIYYETHVIVTINWIQQAGVMYVVRVSSMEINTGNGSYHLTALYNTRYNLSVVATAPCRPNAAESDLTTLNYGE